ncbi:MAG: bifunctional diaminohydroxyphosphoribosylaminopyrimidine deaminase/5-amino-6-(5-phosphoribosylamino)uracil reductase RibD [Candidatus Omnitrophica bacterium]|nr:bifunctional diaminohydroxyphosphoribosylaminopyrimidine deaminase/5-amino-6-(5-phosphoribosylamino)uracil reductase RibD [Candidatus Omnitrophota bacterium]
MTLKVQTRYGDLILNKHEYFMKMTLELAEKGRGRVSPNPMVGAVVVKNSRIISSAYHRRVGGLHAEALALKIAGKKARGAALYVNLEPCAHVGRTPACTDAIVKSRVKRVFCSMKDPNPVNNGHGIDLLRKNKINVSVGLLREEAQKLNKVFIKYITKNMPFVTLKIAESLDGKIATRSKDSKWITSDASRSFAHKLRSETDAVLVGVNTVIRDNPILTSRRFRTPVKVILDPYLNVQERAYIFSKKSPALNIIAILKKSLDKKAAIQKIRRLNKKGVLVISCPGKYGRIDLEWLLRELAELEIAHLLVEGGGDTLAGFLENGLADRVLFFIAPKIIGGKDAITSVEGRGVDKVNKSVKLEDIKVERIGEDVLIRANIKSLQLKA